MPRPAARGSMPRSSADKMLADGPPRHRSGHGKRGPGAFDLENARDRAAGAARHRLHQRPRHRHAAKRPGRNAGHSPRHGPAADRSAVRQRDQVDAGPPGQRLGQRRTGDHDAGDARRFCAADFEPHAARSASATWIAFRWSAARTSFVRRSSSPWPLADPGGRGARCAARPPTAPGWPPRRRRRFLIVPAASRDFACKWRRTSGCYPNA